MQKVEITTMYSYSYTTTQAYANANQLVTSAVNGVTAHYKYDAAGRMIQAGDKKYIYNGQNKVTEVRQNGKIIAKFEHNIDGQIAKAIYADIQENNLITTRQQINRSIEWQQFCIMQQTILKIVLLSGCFQAHPANSNGSFRGNRGKQFFRCCPLCIPDLYATLC